ncbi:pyruvate carboxylase [Pyramidobacter piscolens]|nr:pyruvate carboxylase [Pyramidobacter piscolens]
MFSFGLKKNQDTSPVSGDYPGAPAATAQAPKRPVKICSVDLRDGQQSLLATRMTTAQILPVIAKMDNVGFESIEMWGGATFDSCMRFLNEDPFERLRLCKQAAPKTPFRMLLRGQNLLGYKQYADDVVERFVKASARNGMNIFLIFDGLNDTRNCRKAFEAAIAAGARADGNIMYTSSPVHNDKLYTKVAKEYVAMGATAIRLEDMAGMIDPVSTARTIHALKEAVDVPIGYQTHCTGGMGDIAVWEAIQAGADIVDADFSAFSLGTAHPPLESLVVALEKTPWATGIKLDQLAEINEMLAQVRCDLKQYESAFTGVDIGVLRHQIPGGMLSNMESQLKQMQMSDRIGEVLHEVARVHKDFGYPPLCTPFSQIVGVQATMNVMCGVSYKMMPNESKDYLCGRYGAFPAPVDPELQKKAMSSGRSLVTCRPADLIPPEFDKRAAECASFARSEEEILEYCLYPEVAKTFLMEKHGIA